MGCRAVDKQVYVATGADPVAYSIADNLFWNDIMMEHAKFFVSLMPGPELAPQREIAQRYQAAFARHFAESQHVNPGNYRAFNQRTIDLVHRFRDQKLNWQAQQAAGQLRSLVWPVFFAHTAREADRFGRRLAMYSGGHIEFERPEVVDFWSKTMSEHAGMMAHLLDPTEKALFAKASAFEARFANAVALGGGPGDPVMAAAREIIDFKTVAEQGICSGQIKSIIDPELGAHMRREAIRFTDELQRASAGPLVGGGECAAASLTSVSFCDSRQIASVRLTARPRHRPGRSATEVRVSSRSAHRSPAPSFKKDTHWFFVAELSEPEVVLCGQPLGGRSCSKLPQSCPVGQYCAVQCWSPASSVWRHSSPAARRHRRRRHRRRHP
jgi:hypothetical protein